MVVFTGKFEKSQASPRRILLRRPASIPLYFDLRKASSYTMVRHESLMQMRDLIKRIDEKKVEGSIVETGCWRGGCSAFMARVSKKNGSNRTVWMFDSFEGLPKPKEVDKEFFTHMRVADTESFQEALSAPIEKAQEAVAKLGVVSTTRIVKGWFKDTLPVYKKEMGKIAILRLDGDLYDSTKVVLDELYDQLSPGGYVVIDDYVFDGVRKALYDFFHERKIAPFLEEDISTEMNKLVKTYFRV